MTKKELIEFLNELVELASEENKTKAVSVKKNLSVTLKRVTDTKRR